MKPRFTVTRCLTCNKLTASREHFCDAKCRQDFWRVNEYIPLSRERVTGDAIGQRRANLQNSA